MSFEDEAAGVALQASQRLIMDATGRLTSGLLALAKAIAAGSWHAVSGRVAGAASQAWETRKLRRGLEEAGAIPEYARGEDGRAEPWFDYGLYRSPVPPETAAVLDQLAWDGLVDASRARAADTYGRAHQLINEVPGHFTFVKGLDNPMDPRASGDARAAREAESLGRRDPRGAERARKAGARQAAAASAASATPWRDPALWGKPMTDRQRFTLDELVDADRIDPSLAARADSLGSAHAVLNTDDETYAFIEGLDDPLDPRAPEWARQAWLEAHPQDAGREPWDDMAHPPFAGWEDEAAVEPTAGEFVEKQVGDDVAVGTAAGGNARGRARGRSKAAPRSREDAQEREEALADQLVAVSFESEAAALAVREDLERELGVESEVAVMPDGGAVLVADWPADRAAELRSRAWEAAGARGCRDMAASVEGARAAVSGAAPSAGRSSGPALGRRMGEGL